MSNQINVIQKVHLFLLTNVDGNHADRFLESLAGTHMDPNCHEALQFFQSRPYVEQIKCIVDYWIMQNSYGGGVPVDMTTANHFYAHACENIDKFMWSISPVIEQLDLPILNKQG